MSDGRPELHGPPGSAGRSGFGCLGPLLGGVIVVAIVIATALIGLVMLAVVAAIVVIALVVWAIDRVALAVSPKRRERRQRLVRTFDPRGPIIDATVTFDEPTHRRGSGEVGSPPQRDAGTDRQGRDDGVAGAG